MKYWWNKLRIFIFRIFTVKFFFNCSKIYFLVFSLVCCQTTFFLIQQFMRKSFQICNVKKKRNMYIINRKFKFCSINTGFIFIYKWKLLYLTRDFSHLWNIYFYTTRWKSSLYLWKKKLKYFLYIKFDPLLYIQEYNIILKFVDYMK
jgi:hypothetical protein